ncbi:MAG: hypothetical protein LBD14_06540, partial [Puniceicoccales bacterium]|nr:hypothetical protein [Puniceicoccales bacterium]
APAEGSGRSSPENGDAKAVRQEAAIKYIVPEPAPVVAETAEKASKKPPEKSGGFLSWIASWFQAPAAAEPEPEARPQKKPRNAAGPRDNRRGPRNGRRDEERESREPRPPREPKEAREPRPAQPATREEAQKPRERRQRNEPRPERKEKEPALPPVTAEAVESQLPENAAKAGDEGQNGASRRRGRRGGRKDRVDTAVETVAVMETADDTLVPAFSFSAPPVETGEPLHGEIAPASPSSDVPCDDVPAGPSNPQLEMPLTVFETTDSAIPGNSTETENAPEDILAPIILMAEATQIPAPPETAVPVEDPAPPATETIDEVLANSGLVMIETSSDKIQAQQTEAAPPAPRPRRQRSAPVAVPEEPLVMVETRQP